jgi:hypothetical protein
VSIHQVEISLLLSLSSMPLPVSVTQCSLWFDSMNLTSLPSVSLTHAVWERHRRIEMHFIHPRKGQLFPYFLKFYSLPFLPSFQEEVYCLREGTLSRKNVRQLSQRSNRKTTRVNQESRVEEGCSSRDPCYSLFPKCSERDKREQNEWEECTLLLRKRKT